MPFSFTMLFSGARRFLSRSYIWGAINAFAIVLVLADLTYYQQIQGDLGIAAVTLAILLALAWGVVQLLTLPTADRTRPEESEGRFPAGADVDHLAARLYRSGWSSPPRCWRCCAGSSRS